MITNDKIRRRLVPVYLKEYFEERPNETLSSEKLLDMLNLHGIDLWHRALAEYIKALRVYGMDIKSMKGPNGGYYYKVSGNTLRCRNHVGIGAVQD